MIGLSILSGSHRELIPAVLEALRDAGAEDVPVVVGGIIPEADGAAMREAGIAAVYTPKDWDLNQHDARHHRARRRAPRGRERRRA